MDTKEMIREINNYRTIHEEISPRLEDIFDEVISLLQSLSTAKVEGEKYKEMWEGIKAKINSYKKTDLENMGYFIYEIYKVEQKYFPSQTVKKIITIEVEGEDGKLDWSINALKKYINNMIMDGMKVNIKEED
jgi:hypothetical protein